MSSTHRIIRLWPLAILACISMAAAVGVVAVGADAKTSSTKKSAKKSTKRVTRSCKAPKYPGDGYFNEIRATRISCSYSRKFVVRFYKCRTRSSKSSRTNKSGRCTTRLSRFKCSERRNSISTQIASTVTCRRGKSRIIHSYQQNL